MKTLVTGGLGFIGSHLVKKLVDTGRSVRIVDISDNKNNLYDLGLQDSDFEFINADLVDYSQAKKAFDGIDIVFHMASRIGGIHYLHGNQNVELLTLQENLAIDSNIFRCCVEKKIRKIIQASSAAIYPMVDQYNQGTVLHLEDADFSVKSHDPRNKYQININSDGGYGIAKAMAEVQLSWMHDIKIGSARIFNIYGPNRALDEEKSHMVVDLIRKAIGYPKNDFIVWGDGSQTRDFLYISDCIDALVAMEEKVDSMNEPLILNIGSGREVSVNDVAREIINISGKDIEIKNDLNKPVGPISRTADISKTKELLNWEPKVELKEGLKLVYQWVETKIS